MILKAGISTWTPTRWCRKVFWRHNRSDLGKKRVIRGVVAQPFQDLIISGNVLNQCFRIEFLESTIFSFNFFRVFQNLNLKNMIIIQKFFSYFEKFESFMNKLGNSSLIVASSSSTSTSQRNTRIVRTIATPSQSSGDVKWILKF